MNDIESISNIICELCEHASTNIKEHEKHYDMEHHGEECTVSCVFPKCDFSSNCPEELIEHFKVVHDRWIQKNYKEKMPKINYWIERNAITISMMAHVAPIICVAAIFLYCMWIIIIIIII